MTARNDLRQAVFLPFDQGTPMLVGFVLGIVFSLVVAAVGSFLTIKSG